MDQPRNGKAIIFSAPSGAGKTTLVREMIRRFPNFVFSVSATTRPPREVEIDGRDYHFIAEESFRQRIAENAFLEWEEVYPGRFYGTLIADVERLLQSGRDVVFDVDVKGGLNVKHYFGARALAIFVMPPSLEALRQRLVSRGSDSPEDIERRCSKAAEEMAFAPQFDHIILNDTLEHAISETEAALQAFLAGSALPAGFKPR